MLFRKRKQASRAQSLVTGKLSAGYRNLEKTCVQWLQQRERRLSLTQKKRCWLLYCLLFGGASAWMLTDAILRPTPSFGSTIIRASPITKTPLLPTMPTARISSYDSVAIRQFRHWMDSMNVQAPGKKYVDSFLQAHPGWLDSFQSLEAIIQP